MATFADRIPDPMSGVAESTTRDDELTGLLGWMLLPFLLLTILVHRVLVGGD